VPLLAVALGLGLFSVTGCSLVATTMWIINPNDVDAEYGGLIDRRVAVVCQAGSSLPFHSYTVTQDLTVAISRLLRENVDKIDIVDPAEISDWTDHNELTSYSELGKAMDAELVVVVDLVDFRVRKGTTMLQGQAHVEVEIHDVAKDEIVHRLAPIHSAYPPNSGVPADLSKRSYEARFQSQYVRVLADQIARRFYPHDSRADIRTDRFYDSDG
jgi:hypothetical protein